MINVVLITEDNNLIERLEPILKNNNSYNYHSFDNAKEAMEYIENDCPELGIISLDMTVVNGEELADYMIEYNLYAKFCFIFNENNIENACSLFNRYNKCKLLNDSLLSADEIKNIIENLYYEYTKEADLNKEIEIYRELEKSAKEKMTDMSDILNARIECYNSLNEVIVNSIKFLCSDLSVESLNLVINFLNYLFAQFIHDYLIEGPKLIDSIDSLVSSLNDKENKRHYNYVTEVSDVENLFSERISFASFMLSHMFADFLEKYRIKLELKENDLVYRLDFLVDIRLGNPNKEIFDGLSSVAKFVIKNLCDKLDYANKDGIIQYRMFFKKETA